MSMNGSGNGHDPGDNNGDKKIVKFPTLSERDRMRREDRAEEERWRAAYKKRSRKQSRANREPFFNFGNIPPFTRALVASFIVIHIVSALLLDDAAQLRVFYTFGFIPGMYSGTFEWNNAAFITPLAHAFIHGSWMHLLFNTIMGLALGIFFERLYGPRLTALFFAVCTLAGAALYFLFSPFTVVPVVGASGGISGFFGALIYITMVQNTAHPLTQRFSKNGPWPVLIFWGVLIVLPGLLTGGAMAWEAHLGGYIAGIALLIQIQKRRIKL